VKRDPVQATTERSGGIAQAASLLALGSIASRVLGLAREAVIAGLFGASGMVSVFRVASIVPTMLYELLVGGMLSAALVPVLSQVAEQEGRPALWALFGRVMSLIALLLAALVLSLELLAPQVAWLLGGGFSPELQTALAQMLRLIAPALFFFGLSGAVTGLLYTLKRFSFPALGAGRGPGRPAPAFGTTARPAGRALSLQPGPFPPGPAAHRGPLSAHRSGAGRQQHPDRH